MTDRYLDYLAREHERLEDEIRKARKQLQPNEVQIARLKKLKLALTDHMAAWRCHGDATDRLSA